MSRSTITRSRWQVNPILVKEVRSQMRGGRAFVLLTGLLFALCAIGYGLFLLATGNEAVDELILSAQVGQTLFGGLAFTLLLGVCIIAPAITVSAISNEHERLTYEMLVATRMTPGRILWGKLIAALSYVALLLLAAIPLGSIIFIFGGITLKSVVQAGVIIVATAVTAALIGLWASALTRNTTRATILSYLILVLVLFGLLFSSYVWTLRKNSSVPLSLVNPNPMSALASIMAPMSSGFDNTGGMPRPFDDRMIEPMIMDSRMPTMFGGMGSMGGINRIPGWRVVSLGVYPAGDPNQAVLTQPRGIWRSTLSIEIFVCIVLFWMSLHLVRPRRRWSIGWQDALMLSLTLFTVVGLGAWRGWWF